MAKKKKAKKKKAKKKAEASEPEEADLSSFTVEEILDELKRRNLTPILVHGDSPVNIMLGEPGDDEDEEEEEEEEEEEGEGEDGEDEDGEGEDEDGEGDDEDGEGEEAEIEVGSKVTFEEDGEEVEGEVTEIDGDNYTVEDEEYSYEKTLDDLTLVSEEEEEEEEGEGDEKGDGDGQDWSEYSIDNLGLTKGVKKKLEKTGIESIGEVQKGLEKPKGFKKKTGLSDAEIKKVKKALDDLD